MKKYRVIIFTALVCILFSPFTLMAQNQVNDNSTPTETQPRGINFIPCSEYTSAQYNGHTVQEINATEGRASQLELLWGAHSSVSDQDASHQRLFKYNSTSITFNTEFRYLTAIEITDPQWTLLVQEKELRVGDHFSDLTHLFGDSLKIIFKPAVSSNYVVSFNCPENEYDGLMIYFNPSTDKATKIKYYKRP